MGDGISGGALGLLLLGTLSQNGEVSCHPIFHGFGEVEVVSF
jgi:hypothetical protein